jgi:diguanylate cyclase (GGDEF)-like protein
MSAQDYDRLMPAIDVPDISGLSAMVELVTFSSQLLTKAKEACMVLSSSPDGFFKPALSIAKIPRLKIITSDRLAAVSDSKEWIWLNEDDALLLEMGMTTGPYLYVSLHFRTGILGGIILAEPAIVPEVHLLTLRKNASLAFENALLTQEFKNMIQYLSDYDDLVTKLPNRRVFHNLLVDATSKAPPHQPSYLFFIDLDDLKQVNRKLGYNTGDRLLSIVAQRMLDFVTHRKIGSIPARIGGDEFAILLNSTLTQEKIENIAGEIIADIRRPVKIHETNYMVTASMGISNFPTDATTADELIFCAEQAMFSAKDGGKNTYKFFNQGLKQL